MNSLDLPLGCLLSGGVGFVVSFILLAIHSDLGPRHSLSDNDKRLAGSAFNKALAVGVAIWLLGFVMYYFDHHGWVPGARGG